MQKDISDSEKLIVGTLREINYLKKPSVHFFSNRVLKKFIKVLKSIFLSEIVKIFLFPDWA